MRRNCKFHVQKANSLQIDTTFIVKQDQRHSPGRGNGNRDNDRKKCRRVGIIVGERWGERNKSIRVHVNFNVRVYFSSDVS